MGRRGRRLPGGRRKRRREMTKRSVDRMQSRLRSMFWPAWVVVLFLMLFATPALAQGNQAEAEKFFRAGEQAYRAGQYSVAAQAFEEAYKLMPVPAIAFSTAQAYRLQYFIDKKPERLKRAIDLYRTYIDQVPKGGRREDAVANLAELEPILLRIEAEGQTTIQLSPASQVTQLMVSSQVVGARAWIDDVEGEVPHIREVTPGSHKIKVAADGYYPVEQSATAVAGKLIPIEVTLKPKPAMVRIRTESGARVAVDGRTVGRAPFSRALEVDAGRHFVSIASRGRRAWSREIRVDRGEEIALDASLTTTTQRKLSYWVLGASGVAFVAAGVVGMTALGAQSDAEALEDKRQSEGLTPAELAEYHDLRQRRDDRLGTTYLLLGIGGAVALTSVLMMLLDQPGVASPPGSAAPMSASEEGVVVSPSIGGDSAGLAVSGAF